jgi:hypothetical protein
VDKSTEELLLEFVRRTYSEVEALRLGSEIERLAEHLQDLTRDAELLGSLLAVLEQMVLRDGPLAELSGEIIMRARGTREGFLDALRLGRIELEHVHAKLQKKLVAL